MVMNYQQTSEIPEVPEIRSQARINAYVIWVILKSNLKTINGLKRLVGRQVAFLGGFIAPGKDLVS